MKLAINKNESENIKECYETREKAEVEMDVSVAVGVVDFEKKVEAALNDPKRESPVFSSLLLLLVILSRTFFVPEPRLNFGLDDGIYSRHRLGRRLKLRYDINRRRGYTECFD